MESDTEDEEIPVERDDAPLQIRISGARSRGGPPAAAILAPIHPGICVVNVKPPHLVDFEIERMKKFILDYKSKMSTTIATENTGIYFGVET